MNNYFTCQIASDTLTVRRSLRPVIQTVWRPSSATSIVGASIFCTSSEANFASQSPTSVVFLAPPRSGVTIIFAQRTLHAFI